MNFIQEWGALGELNNKGVVAISLGSFFYFTLFLCSFFACYIISGNFKRKNWMVNRLSAHVFHNGDQTTIDSRKIQIFCHKKQRLRLRIILKKSNVKKRARRDFTFDLHDLRRTVRRKHSYGNGN